MTDMTVVADTRLCTSRLGIAKRRKIQDKSCVHVVRKEKNKKGGYSLLVLSVLIRRLDSMGLSYLQH
jgi:hypothetical protein